MKAGLAAVLDISDKLTRPLQCRTLGQERVRTWPKGSMQKKCTSPSYPRTMCLWRRTTVNREQRRRRRRSGKRSTRNTERYCTCSFFVYACPHTEECGESSALQLEVSNVWAPELHCGLLHPSHCSHCARSRVQSRTLQELRRSELHSPTITAD